MPRVARVVVPGVALHIVQRGHDRRECFREDVDRLVYLACLAEALKKTGCALHAYCLMTNHVHLLLTPPDADACAYLMRNLGQRYVQYFNRRRARSGTLWEGRFHSCLVDSAAYVLACYRYIERNPVRAHIVGDPGEYAWSSHQGNSGQATNGLLTPHPEYAALGSPAHYTRFARDAEDPVFVDTLRDATNGGLPLVGEALKARLAAGGVSVEAGKPGRPVKREAENAAARCARTAELVGLTP